MYVSGAQKNRLIEAVTFEYQQHMFWFRDSVIALLFGGLIIIYSNSWLIIEPYHERVYLLACAGCSIKDIWAVWKDNLVVWKVW